MRLLEAIVAWNQRVTAGEPDPNLPADRFSEGLPLIALTCIDPRLNAHFPNMLGLREEQFIWLRNAGNVVADSIGGIMRSLALACAVKGGREIAIIGHSDCGVRRTSVSELIDRFRDLGVTRNLLPDDLVSYFGLFASERQNVLRGVDFVRQSPIIGRSIPVHGLLIDVVSGRIEWVANGYEAHSIPTTSLPREPEPPAPPPTPEPPPAPPSLPRLPKPQRFPRRRLP